MNILSEKLKKNIKVAKWFAISLAFVAVMLMVVIIGCNYIGNRNFKETFYSVSSLKVDNKIRIIQISDLHSCLYGRENKKLINRVEKLNPDLIIYTGDCADAHKKSTERVISLCEKLSKVAPSYYIYGNNEVDRVYDMALTQKKLDKKFGFNDENRDPEKLLEISDSFEQELEKAGVRVLKNETETITIGYTEVDIFGVLTSNPSAFWSYSGEPFDEYIYTNTNHLKIMAIHEPLVFEEYNVESWGDIMLSGHTHGGIIRIPMVGPLLTKEGGLFPERKGYYVQGKYDVSGRPLIVSSGLENRNILRINNQPELVVIDVNRF